MSGHRVVVDWRLDGDFVGRRYSRAHTLDFGHGVVVPGSSSPSVVPLPFSRADAVDPEAAFVAALSACHMLWFLDLAARAGFVAESYRDEAEGLLTRGPDGKLMMTRVALRPQIAWRGASPPTAEQIADLHHRAHEQCFLANSVKTEVVVEPQ